jgi:GT2 family glycosyltransferase
MNKDCCTDKMPSAQILAIVVRYKMLLTESPAIQGLLQAFACHPGLHNSVSVLIWDNSPTPLNNPELISSFAYKHSQTNLGVSGAYNQAMKIAESMGCQWLLLLDQDTVITADFLPQMLKLGGRFLDKPEIAAVVPILIDDDRILSPRKVLFKKFKPLQQPFEGVYPGKVTAANSGTLVRIEALEQIGGFNEDFWLDFSDVVVFHLLHQHGKQVYIAGNLLLKHKISVLDFENSLSPQRYSNFIAAEGAYWDAYGTVTEQAFHTLRIFERAIRQKRRLKNSAYAKITLAYFFKRLLHNKKDRLRWWKLQSLQRNIPR